MDIESENALDNGEHPVNHPEKKSLNLGWRVMIGAVVLLFLGILAFPLIQEQIKSGQQESLAATPRDTLITETASAIPEEATPKTAGDFFELGNSYYETRQWERAIEAYKKAIELDPEYQGAFANLGVTYYQQQEFNLAALQYEKALELNPEDGEVAYNLGALYLQQALSQSEAPSPDLLDKAISQLEKALEISPDLAEPHFTLGVAYFFQNKNEAAIKAFETYLSLAPNPEPQAKQEAERYLNILRAQ